MKFLSDVYGLFIVNQKDLDTNLWMLTQRSKGGVSMETVMDLPFWRYEQFVDIANKIAEDEKSSNDEQSAHQQSGMPNPSSYLNKMSGMANKFKK